MSTLVPAREGALPQLTGAQKASRLRFAQTWVIATMVFTGVSLALGAVMLAPYPGTDRDPILKSFGYTAVFVVLATALKFGVVRLYGSRIEAKLDSHRPIKLRQAFSRDVRMLGIVGGAGQAVYSILTVTLIAHLAPSSLGAARALVLLPIAGLDLYFRVINRQRPGVIRRVVISCSVSLVGAGVVIVGGPLVAGDGFHIFTGPGSALSMILLIALLVPGNLLLAIAEFAEWHGAQRQNTSAPVYTLARFLYFSITCVVVAVGWGLIRGDLPTLLPIVHMCVVRWYLLLPVAVLYGLTDLARICVKRVVSTTSMYVIAAASVAVNAVVQAVAKHIAPQYYGFVPDTWVFMALCMVGAALIMLGTWYFPHPKAGDTH